MSIPADLKERIKLEAIHRRELYNSLIAWPQDPPAKQEENRRRLLEILGVWSLDTVKFIKDNAWAPDPRDLFGASSIPPGYAPQGMVPVILYPTQREMIEKLDAAMAGDGQADVVIDACRQVIKTTGVVWAFLKYWLFRPSTYGVWTTYAKDLVDSGGKGQRDIKSLLGRFRLFLDAFMWNYSVHGYPDGWLSQVRFNQNVKTGWSGKRGPKRGSVPKVHYESPALTDSEDIAFKIARPKWLVHGVEVAPDAKGNLISGVVPGADAGRSFTGSYFYADEFQRYNDNFGEGTDRATWGATAVNFRVRVVTCTVPLGGGSGTEAKRLCTEPPEGTIRHSTDWCDVPPYLANATWECPECSFWNGWLDVSKGPGEGQEIRCASCGAPHMVTRFNLSSPWLRTAVKRSPDILHAHAEIYRNWSSAMGDRFFASWSAAEKVQEIGRVPGEVFVEGFNPGHSGEHPASWWLVSWDPAKRIPRLVGYWMASITHIEWWVPFMKRWTSEKLLKQTKGGPDVLRFGKFAGERFIDVFRYDEDALKMLDRVAQYPLPEERHGDKYGTHKHMLESIYEVLQLWGIDIQSQYTSDRGALVRNGREWAARLVVDREIANARPKSAFGQSYPSPVMLLESARPKPYTGHGEYKLDVDSQEPKFVRIGCDPWFYLCRAFEGELITTMGTGGELEISADHRAPVVVWGEGAL